MSGEKSKFFREIKLDTVFFTVGGITKPIEPRPIGNLLKSKSNLIPLMGQDLNRCILFEIADYVYYV